MPAPASFAEFVDLVRRAHVVDEPRLNGYVAKLKADPQTPTEVSALAGKFVHDGLLTYFQAEQFLQGRWKRFTIGKYKVLEKLGSGGMGQVFLCEHKLMRRRVAIKVLPTAKAADPSSLDRFYREARAVAALDHVNIVRAYDIDQDDNLHFLVMEWVDGASFQEMVRKGKPMDVVRACHYMYWSAIGLEHAHKNGLIHRDIKPGNILVDRTGIVKILDLGLARFFNDSEDMLTKKYDESVLGTADYLAPEQAIDSHTVDGRADIYSLGATFYFLLTGQPPFADGSVAQKLLWHQTRMPKPVRDVRPDIPADVAAVLEKMMAKKADDRYETPGQLAEALLPFTQVPIGPPPDEEMPQLSKAATGAAAPSMSSMAAPRTVVVAPKTPTPSEHIAVSPIPVSRGGSTGRGLSPDESDAVTQRNKPVPVVEPIPDSVPGAVWENLAADTANSARDDTDRRRGKPSSRRLGRKPAVKSETPAPKPRSSRKMQPQRRVPWALIGSLALLLVVVGGVSAYWFGFRGKSKETIPVVTGPRTLVVTKSPAAGEVAFDSIQKAIVDFKPGDTIVLKDAEWEETAAASRVKSLVIVAAPGKTVVWRAPSSAIGQPVLSLAGTEGARVAGIRFQGNGRSESILRLNGNCSGTVIEDVELLDATGASLALHDCNSGNGPPVTVRRVRMANPSGRDGKAAVAFTANPPGRAGSVAPGNQSIVIHRCLLEGPFLSGFAFEGSAQAIDISQCRVRAKESGLAFRRVDRPAEVQWRVDVTNNTFDAPNGVRIDDAAQLKVNPKNLVTLEANYFLQQPAHADGDINDAKFLVSENKGNFRKSAAPPGMLVQTGELPVDLPPTLLYERSSDLFKAFGGKPVGAPPQ